jgi:hypothetical protein
MEAKGDTLPWTGSSLDQVLILPCTRTKDKSAEMAVNLLIPECFLFRTLSRATPRHNCNIRSKCLKAEGCTLFWTGSSFDQVLILPCTRTKDESAAMAGNPLIPERLDFCTSSLATPQHKRKYPIKALESRE